MHLPLDPKAPADFDFFMGRWNIRYRRLKERLRGCSEWDEFDGRSTVWKVLGGYGNVDDNLLYLPDGTYRALTLRSYDKGSGQWSIWWLDGRRPGSLDVPVVGRFTNGIGTFVAEETLDGKPIVVRFTWTAADPESPAWEQAFSPDGGRTWEPNWTMRFTRAA